MIRKRPKRVLSFCWHWSKLNNVEKPRSAGYEFGEYYAAFWPGLLRSCLAVYPSWEIRIHHDNLVLDKFAYGPVLRELDAKGIVKLVPCGTMRGLRESNLWRMKPLWDDEVELFRCEDLDSYREPRERMATEEWIFTDAVSHSILDNAGHTIPYIGGSCGFRKSALQHLPWKSWEEMIEFAWTKYHLHHDRNSDQEFLSVYLWPMLADRNLVHILQDGDCGPVGSPEIRRGLRKIVPEDSPWMTDPGLCHVAKAFTFFEGIGDCVANGSPTVVKDVVSFYDSLCPDAIQELAEVEKNHGYQ